MASDAATRLIAALGRGEQSFAPILGFPLTSANARALDLSVNNAEMRKHADCAAYVDTLDHVNFVW